ncbi:MAG: hypothetical protein IIX48_03770 [Lachnospiraceae bacterium]|nr:hypothetical protein [Lachnospiraceae bacterium]
MNKNMELQEEYLKTGKEEKVYTFEDLRTIIKELRSETGCPWDKRQTHGSLTLCMLEEAAETVYGIKLYEKTANPDSMKEELGDLLMQVVMHACIAEEEGLFTIDDVIDGISQKMIRRHPHVFESDGTPLHGKKPLPENLKSWQEIKEEEKRKQTFSESSARKKLRKQIVKIFEKML